MTVPRGEQNGVISGPVGRPARRWVLAGLLCALVGGGILAAVARAGPWTPWLVAALRSGRSIRYGAVVLVCGALLAGVAGMLWRAGAPHRARPRDPEGGAAILEFVLALPIVLMLVLVMVQASLLMGGNVCVHYAAYCAARSAIVQVPDDTGGAEGPNVMVDTSWSDKAVQIRRAAIWALMPVSCGGDAIDRSFEGETAAEGLAEFFRAYGEEPPLWLDKYVGRKYRYAEDHTTVAIRPPADGSDTYGEAEDIRVRVEHTLYLSVPYAARVLASLDADGRRLNFGVGEYGVRITATCTLTNEGVQDYVDVETIEAFP